MARIKLTLVLLYAVFAASLFAQQYDVLIRNGRVFCDGPKEQVIRSGTLSGLFGIPVEVLERNGYYHVL